MDTPQRVLVLGAGGVGGLVAGKLALADVDVSVVTKNPEIAEAISRNGLRFAADGNGQTARLSVAQIPAYDALPIDANIVPFDMCVVAVPPNFAESAVSNALPFLQADAPILVLCNGLVDSALAERFDASRVVGGVVGFGARMTAPGSVVQTGPGDITVGHLDSSGRQSAKLAVQAMEPVGSRATENMAGVRWSKLAINCAISSLGTIGGDRLGVLMRSQRIRRLALETMTEVVAVANASGVDLEKVAGTLELNWLALTDADRTSNGSASLLAKHTVLLAVGSKYRKMRSSMLAAVERGREPSVRFLNGEVCRRGKELGIATPVNDMLLAEVESIARGEKNPSIENLYRLFDQRLSSKRAS